DAFTSLLRNGVLEIGELVGGRDGCAERKGNHDHHLCNAHTHVPLNVELLVAADGTTGDHDPPGRYAFQWCSSAARARSPREHRSSVAANARSTAAIAARCGEVSAPTSASNRGSLIPVFVPRSGFVSSRTRVSPEVDHTPSSSSERKYTGSTATKCRVPR